MHTGVKLILKPCLGPWLLCLYLSACLPALLTALPPAWLTASPGKLFSTKQNWCLAERCLLWFLIPSCCWNYCGLLQKIVLLETRNSCPEGLDPLLRRVGGSLVVGAYVSVTQKAMLVVHNSIDFPNSSGLCKLTGSNGGSSRWLGSQVQQSVFMGSSQPKLLVLPQVSKQARDVHPRGAHHANRPQLQPL